MEQIFHVPDWVTRVMENQTGHSPTFIMTKKIFASDLDPQQNRILIPKTFVKANLIPVLHQEERVEASLHNNDDNDGRLIGSVNTCTDIVVYQGGNCSTDVPSTSKTKRRKTMKVNNRLLGSASVNACRDHVVCEDGNCSTDSPSTSKTKKRKAVEVGREHLGFSVSVYTRSMCRLDLLLSRWDASRATILKGPELKYVLTMSGFKVGDVVEMWSFRRNDNGKICFAIGKKDVAQKFNKLCG